jgi:hypothetical protein
MQLHAAPGVQALRVYAARPRCAQSGTRCRAADAVRGCAWRGPVA